MICLTVGLQVEVLCQSLDPLILLDEVVILLGRGRGPQLPRVADHGEGDRQEVIAETVSEVLKQLISDLLHLRLLRLAVDLHLQ